MARRVYTPADVSEFHSGTYYPGPNSFDSARRNAKLQQKFARRSRYGKSFGALYNGYSKALIEDDDRAGGIYAGQIVNRLNDGFYGRGRYRRRSYRRRRTYRRRRYRGRGMYMGGRGSYATRFKKFRRQVAGLSSQLKTPLDQMLPGAAALASMAGGAEAGAGVMKAGGMASKGLGILEGQHNSIMAGRGMYVGGRGSYTGVSGNSLIEGLGTSVPNFSTSDDDHGDLIVSHSEFITDVIGNAWTSTDQNDATAAPISTFDSQSISLNPGLSKSFPFLSQIAQNFEEYEFIQMIVTYKPKVSNNLSSTDGQVGSVMMYTDYNSNDDPKRSKQQILQAYGHSSDMITKNILHGIECDPSQLAGDGHHFTRVKPPSGSSTDYNDYDAGLFQLVVANTPQALSNQVIGELWVSYNVKLKKARTFSVYALGVDRDECVFPLVQAGINAPTPTKIVGEWNSIGAEYSIVQSASNVATLGDNNSPWTVMMTNMAILEVTLPQSFSGDLLLSIDCGGTPIQGDTLRPILQGNVSYLHIASVDQSHADVYTESYNSGGAAPAGSDEVIVATNRSWVDFIGDLGSAYVLSNFQNVPAYGSRLYLHAEMAERAIDNKIWMGIPFAGGTSGKVAVHLERFNSRESTLPDPAFRDQA